MALEIKKLRNNGVNDELAPQTITDHQDTNKNDTFGRFIKGAAIAAGGIAAYKTGLLKPVVKRMKKLGGTLSSTLGDTGYYTGSTARKWMNKESDLSYSIFRFQNREKSIFYSIYEDIAGKNSEKNFKRVIKETIEDINRLDEGLKKETKGYTTEELEKFTMEAENKYGPGSKKVREEVRNFKKRKLKELKDRGKETKESSLNKNLNEILYTTEELEHLQKNEGISKTNIKKSKDKLMEQFVEQNTITAKERRLQLKRTGYRSVTLGDIIERYDTREGKFVFKDTEEAKKILEATDLENSAMIHDKLNKIFRDFGYFDKAEEEYIKLGQKKSLWENIIIDRALSISEDGDVVNHILLNKALKGTKESLFDDFGLPVVGFNPLKSIEKLFKNITLGHQGKKKDFKEITFAFQKGEGFWDASITGEGTRKGPDVQDFLRKKFDTDENINLLFSNNKLYAVGDKNLFEELEGDFRGYDITGATKEYQLPDAVRNLRKMSGMSITPQRFEEVYRNATDVNHIFEEDAARVVKTFDPKRSLEEYEKQIEEATGRKMTKIEKLKFEIGRRLEIGYQEFKHEDEELTAKLEKIENNPNLTTKEKKKLKKDIRKKFGGGDEDDDLSQKTNIDNVFDNISEAIFGSKFFKTTGFEYETKEELKAQIKTLTYGHSFGRNFEEFVSKNGAYKHKERNYVFTKKAYNIKDLISSAKEKDKEGFIENLKGYIGQNFSGFDKNYKQGKYYTERTGRLYNVFEVLDRGLSRLNLGLGMDSHRSTQKLISSLLLKRALPVVMLLEAPDMIDYFSEPIFTNKEEKERGENDTLRKTISRNIKKPLDINIHKAGDVTGFTNMFKYLQEMIPGSEHFTELPGIHKLGLGQTAEERKEYIEKGYDPVRKNRYWSASNTPFTGGKIEYWRPNAYRRLQADVKFSETKYGSRDEYYKHTWYPNLAHPLAPIRHFITDPHHWDKKHYNDRPYPVTAAKGENIPLIGPLISGTIGSVYRKKMHEEYWQDGKLAQVDKSDEKPGQLLATGVSAIPKKQGLLSSINKTIQKIWVDTDTFNDINRKTSESYIKAGKQRSIDLFFANFIKDKGVPESAQYKSGYTFKQHKEKEEKKKDNSYASKITNKNIVTKDDLVKKLKQLVDANKGVAIKPTDDEKSEKVATDATNLTINPEGKVLYSEAKEYTSPLQSSTLPYRDYNRQGTALDVYVTPSGQTQIVDVPENLNLYKVNKEIQHYSLNKIYGTNQRVDIDSYENESNLRPQEPAPQINVAEYSFNKYSNNIHDIWGLKGFLLQSAISGERNKGVSVVESSSYAYSSNRSFWDANLGGLGGELSEIGRRFISKREKGVEYLNPIRNTMPTWMPGSNYFTDFKHGDPYVKIMNGEERLPGDAYEKLNNIRMNLAVTADQLANSNRENVLKFLHQDENKTYEEVEERKREKNNNKIAKDHALSNFSRDGILVDYNIKIKDETRNITGSVDASVVDQDSSTGIGLVNIRTVDNEEWKRLKSGRTLRAKDYYEMNYNMFMTNNTNSNGYVYYYNNESQDIYKAKVNYNAKDLRSSIKNLYESRMEIINGLKNGEIGRGELYSLVDKYKILADTAPYSQEFKDISAQVSHTNLSAAEKAEVKAARERMEQQKQPLRVYDYKFKTANLKNEEVTVKKIIDNNTLLVEEYGHEHAIKFAGINVSESNSTLYGPTVKKKKETDKETGRTRTKHEGTTMNEAARKEIEKYIKPGSKITIGYDADEYNKYNKDSTESIKAVITSKGRNVNRALLNKHLATEKENDNSPAAIHVRYNKGDIAFGSMMERLTHTASYIPFIGDKFFQIRSPYEQYRKREVYNKDFKSWNHPIRDYVTPMVQESSSHPIAGIIGGAFIGSMFGRSPYGKLIGTALGAGIPAVGNIIYGLKSNGDRAWRPKRRRQQEELNTYMDALKYVKNMSLYNKYKELAKKEDNFDVDKYLENNEQSGEDNKKRKQELNDYKKKVKLDYENRKDYNFKYGGKPKYEEEGADKKQIIKAINKELSELSNQRKIEKIPLNAIKAVTYKQNSEKTMYAYEPGDDIRNIMAALPKKERQYYSKLVKAPEEEKKKILRIAPSYLRRALQSSWGMKVDEKPSLEEYFSKHALPEQNWAGWKEDVDLDAVKVKMIHANKLDPGEFDVWDDNKNKADAVNIPIPKLNINNDPNKVMNRLRKTLNGIGMENINIEYTNALTNENTTDFDIKYDARDEVAEQISNITI